MSGTGDGVSTARPISLDNRSDCRLHRWAQHHTVRHFAGCDEFPQPCPWRRTGGDEQFAGQSLPLRRRGATIILLRVAPR